MAEELDPELRQRLGLVLNEMKGDRTNPQAADFASFLLGQLQNEAGPTVSASTQCDICSTPGGGTIVKAGDMSDAVRRGFNPFNLGLIPESMAKAAAPGYPERWANSAISGPTSQSDWNVCSTCLATLSRYTGKQDRPAPGLATVQPKRWWEFWKRSK